MNSRSRLKLAPLALVLALTAALELPAEPAGAPQRYDVEVYDVDRLEALAREGAPVLLQYFGRSHPVIVEPCKVRARAFQATASSLGETRRIESAPARTFKGTLAGDPGSSVRLSFTAAGIRGTIKSDEGWVFMEPLKRGGDPGTDGTGQALLRAHKVFTDGDLDFNFEALCEAPKVARARAPMESPPPEPAEASATLANGSLRVLELAIDADVEFSATYGGGSVQEIESVLNVVDGIFQAEIGVKVSLVSVHIWESEPDPYESVVSGTLLDEFQTYWNTNQGDVARDDAVLFTGKELDGATVGIAYVSEVCTTAFAYCLTQDIGSEALMPILVAHELGHNLGASHDPTGSNPRYVMYPSISLSNLDEFSDSSTADIERYMQGVACLSSEDGGSGIEEPPGTGGGKGGGGGGGPVDPVFLALAAAAALFKGLAPRRRPQVSRET